MTFKRLLIASTNPVKINAAKLALETAFPAFQWQVDGINTPSGVADQPLTQQETYEGAQNRLAHLRQSNADFYVAIEGGYDRLHGQPFTFAYIAISDGIHTQIGRSGTLPLPESVGVQLEQGAELGPLMDTLFNDNNIKQKGGAMGVLTNHHIDRTSVYRDTILLLLAPFLHPELFGSK